MTDLFIEAGWSATPISLFGLLTVGAALLLALKPERRFVPLLVALGSLTFTTGALGLVSNIIEVLKSCAHYAEGPDRETIMLGGVGESLSSLVLAFALLIVAMLVAAAGAARLAMAPKPLAA